MFSLPEAATRLHTRLEKPDGSVRVAGVSIDTRQIHSGHFFIALKGSHTDGHAYLQEAFRRHASGALIKKEIWERFPERFTSSHFRNLIPVEDPAKALLELAAWHREKSRAICIGITGSVGKTSTKDFLAYLLKRAEGDDRVLANAGNMNNELGVPLTLLQLTPQHRYCIAELGASRPGDIRLLSSVLKPSAAILTKVAPAHLEGFGSLEAIYETKMDLLRALPAKGYAVVPDDDPEVLRLAEALGIQIVTAGGSPSAAFRLQGIEPRFDGVRFLLNDEGPFHYPQLAPFFAENAAKALALLGSFGFSLDRFTGSWKGLSLTQGRYSPVTLKDGITVIDDAYNASPGSFDAALAAFARTPVPGRKILVFADMLELGEEAAFFHDRLGEEIARQNVDAVFAYGKLAKRTLNIIQKQVPGRVCAHYESAEELTAFLERYLVAKDTLLLKASRGMKMNRVLAHLQKNPRFAAGSP